MGCAPWELEGLPLADPPWVWEQRCFEVVGIEKEVRLQKRAEADADAQLMMKLRRR